MLFNGLISHTEFCSITFMINMINYIIINIIIMIFNIWYDFSQILISKKKQINNENVYR